MTTLIFIVWSLILLLDVSDVIVNGFHRTPISYVIMLLFHGVYIYQVLQLCMTK